MSVDPPKKYFTVDEANQTLPLVRAIVDDIVRLFRDVHERRERLMKIRQLPGAASRNEESLHGEELAQIEEELDKDIDRVNEFSDELHTLGVELKDPIVGLVDFPTKIEGRDAYLCWKLGEEDISFWHELDTGFQGRQPLFENSVSGDEPADDESNGN
jgi:hypothetical protein